MILCLRPLPAVNGGWTSAKWRTPKLAATVAVRPADVPTWLAGISLEDRRELQPILTAPFVAGLRMEGPAAAFDLALAYAEVVAEACAAVVVMGNEIITDRRASVEVWSGSEIETRWRLIDAEAARAEPGYQPVRDATDDHRATQTFTLPIRLQGVEPPAMDQTSASVPGSEPTQPSSPRPQLDSDDPTVEFDLEEDELVAAEVETAKAAKAAKAAAEAAKAAEVEQAEQDVEIEATKSPTKTRPATAGGAASGEEDWSDVMPD